MDDFHKNATPMKLKKLQRRRTALTCIPLEFYIEHRRPSTGNSTRRQGSVDMSEGRQRPGGFAPGTDHKELCCSVSSPYPYNDGVISRTPDKSQSPNKSKEKLPVTNECETYQQQHHQHPQHQDQQQQHHHQHHLYQRYQHRSPRRTLAPTLSLHGDSLLSRAAAKDFEYGEQFLQELHRKCRQVEQRGGGHAAISASGLPKAGTIIDSKINEWYASCQNSITPVTPRRRTFLKSSSVKARALNSMPNSFDEDDVISGKPEQLKVEECASADRNESARTRSEFPSACFERRKAIFDMTGLNNDSNSCSTTSKETCNQKRERKQSSADLGVHYPGDLLSQVRPRKKPLTSRNTIADFAASRVRQTSTVSLLSTTEQDKKAKTPFSLIKRIEKKGHSRSKDGDLFEVLQNLKRSEFKDDLLERLKKVRWYNLLSSSKPSTSSRPPPAADADDDNDEGDSSDGSRRRSDDIGDRRDESEAQQLASGLSDIERKRREAVWELFTSECVFLIDHLMVLKHCFMEPLKEVQVEGHLMVAEPRDLFGNLDEVCLVTHTFCVEFIKMLLKDATETEVGQTKVLLKALSRFCQLTRDGEVYHEYCLNYSKAMNCLEQLRKNEDFVEFEKWCARDSRCHRLYLTDLLIAPMQHCTKVPLLLSNIIKYTQDEDDRQRIRVTSQKLEASLKNLEAKMSWLKNFERMQEIQSQIVWLPITELEPKSYIPEFIRPLLYRQPCERLLANPTRQLLYEGPVSLIEISKTVDMYMFLFDDILLLTKIKKGSKKVTCTNLAPKIINKNPEGPCSNPYSSKSDGTFLVVHRQPISLDRFVIHSIQSSDVNDSWISQASAPDWVTSPQGQGSNPAMAGHPYGQRGFHNLGSDYYHLFDAVDEDANSIENFQTTRSSILTACVPSMTAFLKNSFVIIQITRFQQVIAVYTLQAPNEASKIAWTSRIAAAQHRYNHIYRSRSSSSSLVNSPTQGGDDETDIDDMESATFPPKLNGKKPTQQPRSPDDLAEENVHHGSQNVVRKGRATSQDTDEDFEDDEGPNGDDDLDEAEIDEETTRKKDHGRHARSRTAKQRDSEIGLLDDVFESFGGEEFHGKSHRFRTKTLSKKNKHYSRHLAEDSKSLGTSLSRHNLCGSAFSGCSGFGLKKSALTSSILSNQFAPYAGLANSSYDTFDSFSVNRFDIHERRPALHVESVDLPPSLDALVAASMPAYTTNAQVNQRRQKHVNQRSHPNIQDRISGRYKGDDLYGSRDLSGRFVSTLAPVKLKVGGECEARESSATLPPSSPNRIDIIVSHVSAQAVPELVITTSDIGEASKANPIAPLKQTLRNTYSVPLSSEFPSIPRPRPLKQSPLLRVDSPSMTTGALQPPGHHPKLTSTLSLGPKTVPVGNLIPIEPLLSLESLIYSSTSAGNVSVIGPSAKSPAIVQPASSVSQRYVQLGQGVSSQAIFECSETDRFDQPRSYEGESFLKSDLGVLRATSVTGLLQKSAESENISFADLSTLLQPSAFKMSTGKAASSAALDSENRLPFDKPSQTTFQMSDKLSQNLDIFDPFKSSTMNRAYSNDTMLNVCQSQAYKPCLSTLELGFSNQSDSGSLHRPMDSKGAVQKPVTSPPPARTDDSEQKYGRSKSMRCRVTMDTISEKNIQSKAGDSSTR